MGIGILLSILGILLPILIFLLSKKPGETAKNVQSWLIILLQVIYKVYHFFFRASSSKPPNREQDKKYQERWLDHKRTKNWLHR